MKEVSARLKHSIRRFPAFEKLHPFEQSVLDLAVGAHNYRRILDNIDSLRKKTVKVWQFLVQYCRFDVVQSCQHLVMATY
jgi:GTP1/Obg family GTP-binding protein